MWFTENGRDTLGDDTPHDELNVAAKAGLHFGYPYCHQLELPDGSLLVSDDRANVIYRITYRK